MRTALALALLGGWACAVPYLADATGLELEGISAATEFADHVVPGALAVGVGLLLARPGAAPGGLPWLLAAGTALLAGFWITATHVPLLLDAAEGTTAWDASLLHLSAGPPVLLVALRLLFAAPA